MARKLVARRDDILSAAVDLLSSGGMPALTTTALAETAHCSKKTIYALFPDKDGLLAAIVQMQAETVAKELESRLDGEALTQLDERNAAIRLGAALVSLLMSPASIAINRAAASDVTGHLGLILRSNGRDRLVHQINALLQRATGAEDAPNKGELFSLYYGLLFSDRQVAAILGAKQLPLNTQTRLEEAGRAYDYLEAIVAASRSRRAPDRPDKASRR